MPINETGKEFKRIMDGMLYHCMDLTKFMGAHVKDPYFETENGKKLVKHSMEICANHALICMLLMMLDDDRNDDNERKSSTEIEDLLKGML